MSELFSSYTFPTTPQAVDAPIAEEVPAPPPEVNDRYWQPKKYRI